MPAPVQSGTVGLLVEHIEMIPDHVGIYDFSCVIESECKFSSHDDCECHFDVSTAAEARTLVDHLMKPEDSDRLWAILNSNHGCYITFDTTGQFMTYPDLTLCLNHRMPDNNRLHTEHSAGCAAGNCLSFVPGEP